MVCACCCLQPCARVAFWCWLLVRPSPSAHLYCSSTDPWCRQGKGLHTRSRLVVRDCTHRRAHNSRALCTPVPLHSTHACHNVRINCASTAIHEQPMKAAQEMMLRLPVVNLYVSVCVCVCWFVRYCVSAVTPTGWAQSGSQQTTFPCHGLHPTKRHLSQVTAEQLQLLCRQGPHRVQAHRPDPSHCLCTNRQVS